MRREAKREEARAIDGLRCIPIRRLPVMRNINTALSATHIHMDSRREANQWGHGAQTAVATRFERVRIQADYQHHSDADILEDEVELKRGSTRKTRNRSAERTGRQTIPFRYISPPFALGTASVHLSD